MNSKNKKNNLKSGFTLVELLLTISIFVVITGVVLVNSNNFNSAELLNNFSYDVALTIKQAQSYGVNVRENISGAFNTSYGVYFNLDKNTGGSPTNFILFNDANPDTVYDTDNVTSCPAADAECIQKYSMRNGTFIQSICAGSSESQCTLANQLSILFKRPNLNAIIYKNDDGKVNALLTQPYAKIVLSAANGATSSVVITSVGQIYVKK